MGVLGADGRVEAERDAFALAAAEAAEGASSRSSCSPSSDVVVVVVIKAPNALDAHVAVRERPDERGDALEALRVISGRW